MANELDALRTERGRTGTTGALPAKIVFDLPSTVGVEFAAQFNARLVDQTTAPWELSLGLLQAFVAREGHARVPQDHTESGAKLGKWVAHQRRFHALGMLSGERTARLAAVDGWSWDPYEELWDANFAVLEAFVAREGHARVSQKQIESGVQLGSWVGVQRMTYSEGTLLPDRIARLESLTGWSWDPSADRWDDNFELLEVFIAREGNSYVPARHVENGVQLGGWVDVQRRRHADGTLTPERATRLAELEGWSWDPSEDQWNGYMASLESFVSREGHARVPQKHVESGMRLGAWVNTQRTDFRRGCLSPERAGRLESLTGWSWDPSADRWDDNFELLEVFITREGNSRVPARHVENGVQLGGWVSEQRTARARSRLSPDRIDRLEAVPGWSWHPKADQWGHTIALLEQFVAREGHARVPIKHVEDDVRLGSWAGTQRTEFRRGRLSPERVARLEAFPGWTWRQS